MYVTDILPIFPPLKNDSSFVHWFSKVIYLIISKHLYGPKWSIDRVIIDITNFSIKYSSPGHKTKNRKW
jgi:hypothetical protein